MKLRVRVALTTALVSLPMITGLIFWDERSRTIAAEDELLGLVDVLARDRNWRAACERDPLSWSVPPQDQAQDQNLDPRGSPMAAGPMGGMPQVQPLPPNEGGFQSPRPPRGAPARGAHRKPALFYAYNDRFEPASPQAPFLSAETRQRAETQRVVRIPVDTPERAVRILVALPAPARRCRHVLAEGTMEPWLGGVLPPTRIWLAPLLVIVAAVLLAVGPFIRRVHRLIAAVERSAASGYRDDVLIGGNDEVSALAQAFDNAAQRVRAQLAVAQQRERTLREFLANTTHDVMIPLTVLQGHLSQLRGLHNDDREPGIDKASVLAKAMDEVHYLGSLLHNLSLAAKLDAAQPPIHLDRLELCGLLERVVSRHQPVARQLEVSLNCASPDEPLWAEADLTMLEQAVSNLVYNAIRHNRAGGHAAVILEVEGSGAFSLRVLDDGPGISEAELSLLAQRGFRGNEARTRDQAGQGLGLNIAQRVAELHGFTLHFGKSEFGGLEAQLRGLESTRARGAVAQS